MTLEDIELANTLAHEVLGRSLDELPPQTRSLLSQLEKWVSEQCEKHEIDRSLFHFSRRQLRERFGFGDTQLKVHLARLVDLEYLVVLRNPEQSQGFIYELLYAGEGEDGKRFLSGLLETNGLKCSYDMKRSGSGRCSVGAQSAGGRVAKNGSKASSKAAKKIKGLSVVENAQAPQKLAAVVSPTMSGRA